MKDAEDQISETIEVNRVERAYIHYLTDLECYEK